MVFSSNAQSEQQKDPFKGSVSGSRKRLTLSVLFGWISRVGLSPNPGLKLANAFGVIQTESLPMQVRHSQTSNFGVRCAATTSLYRFPEAKNFRLVCGSPRTLSLAV